MLCSPKKNGRYKYSYAMSDFFLVYDLLFPEMKITRVILTIRYVFWVTVICEP